jgi:hypothetical protein
MIGVRSRITPVTSENISRFEYCHRVHLVRLKTGKIPGAAEKAPIVSLAASNRSLTGRPPLLNPVDKCVLSVPVGVPDTVSAARKWPRLCRWQAVFPLFVLTPINHMSSFIQAPTGCYYWLVHAGFSM